MIWVVAYLVWAVLVAFTLRRPGSVFQRLNDVYWSALVLIDIAIGFVIFNALWLIAAIGDRPKSGETVSAFAGRCAAKGKGWAIALSTAIDAIFFALTGQRDHCAKEAMACV